MYRLIFDYHKLYALKYKHTRSMGDRIDSIKDDAENIETFISDGETVIIFSDLADLEKLGIDPDDVEVVEQD